MKKIVQFCVKACSVIKETNSPNSRLMFKRSYSVTAHAPPIAIVTTAVGKEECREFMAVFPDIVRDLTETSRHSDIPDVTKWYTKVLQYNVPGGKKNRGLALVTSYRELMQPCEVSNEDILFARVLGWCVEMMQAFFLVMDDVMDQSVTRRGRECWYRHNDNGLIAINDAIMLENGIFVLLKKYFQDKEYYAHLVELFRDVIMKTAMGQSLDILTSKKCANTGQLDLNKFTMDRYKAIVKYKTAYYSFHLPIAAALHMANIRDKEAHRQAEAVLLDMGHYFQIQDDYLDCYGDPSVIGKIGSDIREGKCSWLIVVALQRATQQQRDVLQKYYGNDNDPVTVENVKSVYQEIGIPSLYCAYEDDTYNLIFNRIQQMSAGMRQDIFFKILEKIYKRQS